MNNLTTLLGRTPQKVREIGVLGGGISGLTTAYFLRKMLGESAKITLFEASDRLGGWIDTEIVPFPSSFSTPCHSFVLEKGPRSLRIQGKDMMELVDELNLGEEILPADKEALENRLIYHNNELIALPVGLGGLLTNKFFRKNVIPNALFEVFRPQKFREGEDKTGKVQDESVGDFVERRFGKTVADVLIGALCTGIYSSNARLLSVRSCFPSLFNLEKQSGSVVGGLVSGLLGRKKLTKEEEEERARMKKEKEGRVKSGVYSFNRGMNSIVFAVAASLSRSPTVTFLKESPVKGVEVVDKEGRVKVVFDNEDKEKTMEFDHVFSALPLNVLGKFLAPSHEELANELKSVKYTNTAVINMVFEDKEKILQKYKGFGYLCAPSSSEKIMGVAFDSCTFPAQDNLQQEPTPFNAPLSRVTVMMGGDPSLPNYYNLQPPSSPSAPSPASYNQLLAIARSHLCKHLSLEEESLLSRVKTCYNSIPIYHVGYYQTLERIGALLRGKKEEGKGVPISIVGMGVNGVGVNDCVTTAKKTVEAFVEEVNGEREKHS